MLKFLKRAFGLGRSTEFTGRCEPRNSRHHPRLEFDNDFDTIYAIGDIHGSYDKLCRLEEIIAFDAASTAGEKLLVRLGDYIDRGSDSFAVLDHISAPAQGIATVSILGNHEQMLLDILDGSMGLRTWIEFGGDATMRSYGVDYAYLSNELGMAIPDVAELFRRAVPARHREFLLSLPVSVETAAHLFVHAGVRPNKRLQEQTDDDFLYSRAEFLTCDLTSFGKTIVHGHTPGEAVITQQRIGVDTGAHFGGALTAVKITKDGANLMEVL